MGAGQDTLWGFAIPLPGFPVLQTTPALALLFGSRPGLMPPLPFSASLGYQG